MEITDIKPIKPVKGRNVKIGIVMFSISGEPIKIFETIQEAALHVNKTKKETSGIRQCADGKLNTAYGYQWKWLEELNNESD